MKVEFAIDHVVDAAAGAAHQEGAEREHDQQVPAGKASGGDPQGGEGRPQQQVAAGRAVPADQVQVQGGA